MSRVRVAVDGGGPDRHRFESEAHILEDVGVDGERHIEGMRGYLPAPADDLAAERIAADGRVDALVDVVPLPSMEKTYTGVPFVEDQRDVDDLGSSG